MVLNCIRAMYVWVHFRALSPYQLFMLSGTVNAVTTSKINVRVFDTPINAQYMTACCQLYYLWPKINNDKHSLSSSTSHRWAQALDEFERHSFHAGSELIKNYTQAIVLLDRALKVFSLCFPSP